TEARAPPRPHGGCSPAASRRATSATSSPDPDGHGRARLDTRRISRRPHGESPVFVSWPDGTEVEAQGEYTLIDRPHRLMMTWTFDDDPSNEQLIELSFSESEGSTTVLMVNSGISTDERRDAQDQGWHGCLDQLERALAG